VKHTIKLACNATSSTFDCTGIRMAMLGGAAAKVSVIGGDTRGGGCRPTLTVSSDEQGNLGGYLFSVSAGASLTLQGFDMVLSQLSGAVDAGAAGPLKLVWVSVYQGNTQTLGPLYISDTVTTITGGTFDNNYGLTGGVINAFSAAGPFAYDALTITRATFINNQVGWVGRM